MILGSWHRRPLPDGPRTAPWRSLGARLGVSGMVVIDLGSGAMGRQVVEPAGRRSGRPSPHSTPLAAREGLPPELQAISTAVGRRSSAGAVHPATRWCREGRPKEVPMAGDESLAVAARRAVFALAGHVMRPAGGGGALGTGTPTCPQDAPMSDLGSRMNGEEDSRFGAWHSPDGKAPVAEWADHGSRCG